VNSDIRVLPAVIAILSSKPTLASNSPSVLSAASVHAQIATQCATAGLRMVLDASPITTHALARLAAVCSTCCGQPAWCAMAIHSHNPASHGMAVAKRGIAASARPGPPGHARSRATCSVTARNRGATSRATTSSASTTASCTRLATPLTFSRSHASP